jgi:hypothetical protein
MGARWVDKGGVYGMACYFPEAPPSQEDLSLVPLNSNLPRPANALETMKVEAPMCSTRRPRRRTGRVEENYMIEVIETDFVI